MNFELEYGAINLRRMRVVPLSWYQIPLKLDSLPKNLPRTSGLYSFQGCHDAKPNFGVLYIGQGEVLRERLPKSLLERLYWEDKGQVGFYSDVWQAQLHVAHLNSDLLDQVEALLIAGHSPSFNNQHVRTMLKSYEKSFRNLLVLNGGMKGAMLPSVCGSYYLSDEWPSAQKIFEGLGSKEGVNSKVKPANPRQSSGRIPP